MRGKVIHWIMAGAAVFLLLGAVSYGQGPRGFLGVQLDPTPLPELLTKHLGLKADQGIRILNVAKDGPADKVGLDRDDIIILFQGKEVGSADGFVAAVRELPVRSRITLGVIHLGERRTVDFELASLAGEPQWKYPVEAQFEISWGPGTIFRLGPNGGNWVEIPFGDMPDVGDMSMIKKFFSQQYLYHHVTDGENYTIRIEGDPNDESTPVIVQSGSVEQSATVGTIDSLPEKYRAAAKESVENAKKSAAQRLRFGGTLSLPEPPNAEMYRKYFDNLSLPKLDPNEWADKRDRMIERLQGQIDKLQQRLEEMENRGGQKSEKLEKNDANSTSPVQPGSQNNTSSEPPEKARILNSKPI
jgi:hypothetical protein